MRAPVPEDQIAAATAYEELHVPALFRQWVGRVVAAARVEPGERVLDVACGTGVLAREAARQVGAGGVVAGLDPDPGMLAVAARLAPTVDWRQGTAEQLPYPAGAFDAAVCQFGLMFFTDRSRALGEMMRVLAPGGRMALAVWDSLENSQAYSIEVDLLERIGGKRAADALRAPFVLGDKRELAALLESSGTVSPAIETQTGTARFPSISSMLEADLTGWLPVLGVDLEEEMIQTILQEAERALGRFVTADGRVVFEVTAHIVTADKP